MTSIEWYIGDLLVLGSPSHVVSLIHSGDVSRSTLTINLLSTSEGGNRYRCIARNNQGSVSSTEGELTINRELLLCIFLTCVHYLIFFSVFKGSPRITNTPSSAIVQENIQSITLICSASGDPNPTLKWIGPNGTSISDRPDVFIQTFDQFDAISILRWSSLKYSDTGKYSCVASNLGYGPNKPPIVVTSDFTITVQGKIT